MRPYADLFFMGAAFLLLETKNVATFAMLFGTTWLVNALVFAGVLVIVLAAVETRDGCARHRCPWCSSGSRRRWRRRTPCGRTGCCRLPFVPRLLVAVLLAFLPIYLANIAFAKRFSESGDSQAAFAVNILGAIVGGCLEYAALLTGYANLLIVVGALYRHRVPAETADVSGAPVAACSCRRGSRRGPPRGGRSRCGCRGPG